jgi:hypothetical protein
MEGVVVPFRDERTDGVDFPDTKRAHEHTHDAAIRARGMPTRLTIACSITHLSNQVDLRRKIDNVL